MFTILLFIAPITSKNKYFFRLLQLLFLILACNTDICGKVVVCRVCLKDDIVGWFLRPSLRVFHILMADCIHDLDETLVRGNGVEKLLLFLRGYPKIHLLLGEISQLHMTRLVHY